MNLEERIARLIDQEAWECADLARKWGLPVERCERYEQKSRAAARRVIDGIGLTEQTRTMCDGLMPNGSDTYGDTIEHRLVTTWEPQEDA